MDVLHYCLLFTYGSLEISLFKIYFILYFPFLYFLPFVACFFVLFCFFSFVHFNVVWNCKLKASLYWHQCASPASEKGTTTTRLWKWNKGANSSQTNTGETIGRTHTKCSLRSPMCWKFLDKLSSLTSRKLTVYCSYLHILWKNKTFQSFIQVQKSESNLFAKNKLNLFVAKSLRFLRNLNFSQKLNENL